MIHHPFTVVVRCADPRLEPFFAEPGPRERMGLAPERRTLGEAHISNVGGLLPLSGAEVPRLVHDAGLMIRLFGTQPSRIVLTAHTLCGGYMDAVEGDADTIVARQFEDLRSTAHRLRDSLGPVELAAYYLRLEDGGIEEVVL